MRRQPDQGSGTILPAALTIIALILLIAPVSMSVEVIEEDTTTIFDPTGMLRLQASVFLGIGSDRHIIGYTTENKKVTISGGGGLGLELEAGFPMNSFLEISGAFGYQKSSLSQKMKDSDVSFKRSFMRSTLKVRFPVSKLNVLSFGAGGGYYFGGDLDIDLSKVPLPNLAHNIYSYGGATGLHVIGTFEGLLPSGSTASTKMYGGVGLRYSSVKYDLESVTSNGLSIPLDALPQIVVDEFGELDGSGLDVFAYLAFYF